MKDLGLKLYLRIQNVKDAFIEDQSGQDLIEYALVVAIIALAATATMGTLAGKISGAFTTIGTKLDAALPT